MRKFFSKLSAILLAALIAGPALAQDCEAILRGGVFNESVRNSTYESRDIVMRFGCNSNTVNTGGGASAVIYGVPMSANAYREKVKTSCAKYNSDRAVSLTDFSFVRDASAVLTGAWSNCMDESGTRISLKQSPDIRNFLVTVTYRKPGPLANPTARATLTRMGGDAKCTCAASIGGSGCSTTESGFNLTLPDSGTQSLTCTRESVKGILFVLNSDVEGQRTASLPSLSLKPAAIITPNVRFFSGGMCTYSASPIARFQMQVALHDFEILPAMALTYRGHSSSIGTMAIDPNLPFALANVTMQARREDQYSGLYLTIGEQTKHILKQGGNYDCPYNRGKRKIRNLSIDTTVHKLF